MPDTPGRQPISWPIQRNRGPDDAIGPCSRNETVSILLSRPNKSNTLYFPSFVFFFLGFWGALAFFFLLVSFDF